MFLNRFFGIRFPHYFPEENPTPDEVKSDMDILNSEEEEKKDEEVKEEEEEIEEEEATDELVDDDEVVDEEKPEDKLEEKDEADEELVRFSYQELKEAFKDKPELFKAAKTAFFREQKFTEMFPRVEDAQQAVADQQEYEEVKSVVLAGDAKEFLSNVGNNNPKALGKFTENFLPALQEVDEQAYYRITTPVLQNVLQQIFTRAEKKSDENVMNAARVAHFEIFGSYDLGKPSEAKPAKDEEFDKEKAEFYAGKHNELRNGIVSALDSSIDKEIEKGLDPTNSLTSGLKKLLLKTIKEEVDAQIASDKDHLAKMDSLWKRERQVGYSGRFKDSIITAYLSRAKTLIPKIRAEKRAEILNVRKKNDTTTKKQLDERVKRPEAGDVVKGKSRVITVKDAKDKKLSDMDILNA